MIYSGIAVNYALTAHDVPKSRRTVGHHPQVTLAGVPSVALKLGLVKISGDS